MTHRIEPFFNLTLGIESFFLNMTQRIGLVSKWLKELNRFSKLLKELNLFSQSDSKIWTFSQSDSKNCFFFSIWLEELNPLFRICLNEFEPFCRSTQRIEPCFFQYDSKTWHLLKNMIFKNWTFWKYESKDWTFESVTQSTEPSFSIWVNESNPLFQYESKNWTLFLIWLKELNFFEYWLKELNFFECDAKTWTFFLDMTQRLILFLLNFDKKIKELNLLFKSDSKNWIWLKGLNFFFSVTQRIQFLNSFTNMAYSKSSTHLNLFIWLNELDLFYMTQRIEPYWIITQRIESSFSWLKELNFLKRLNELNIFCDPKNWTFFVECDPKNWTFCWMWPKELNHCWKTWRIDPFHQHDWELNPFWTFSYDSKKWTFFEMTQRIKPFWMWLKELNFFYKKWVQEWIFRMWLKELKFSNMTLTEFNISFLEYDAQNWTFLFSNMTHRIEHFFSRIWRTELNISFLEYDAQNWTSLFSNMTHRIEHLISSRIWLTEFFLNMTHRIECLSLIWSKERIEILWYDTKDWIFLIWLTEPNTFQHNSKNWTFFSNWLKEVNFLFDKIWPKGLIFFCYDSKNRTLFWIRLKELNTLLTWLKELNFFSPSDSKKWTFYLTKYDPKVWFFCYDSKNRTLFWMWLKELNFFF